MIESTTEGGERILLIHKGIIDLGNLCLLSQEVFVPMVCPLQSAKHCLLNSNIFIHREYDSYTIEKKIQKQMFLKKKYESKSNSLVRS